MPVSRYEQIVTEWSFDAALAIIVNARNLSRSQKAYYIRMARNNRRERANG